MSDLNEIKADEVEKVVDVIDTYGHIKKEHGDKERGFCLMGAIAYLNQGRFAVLTTTYDAVSEALSCSGSVGETNDTSEWPDLRDRLLGYAKEMRG